MLRPRKRITRKEMKEDPLVTAYVRVQKFFKKNSRHINIALGIFVITMIVGLLMIRSKKQAEYESAGKLGIAEQYYYSNQYEKAIGEINQIVNTYSGTRSAGKATYLLANCYFETGNYEDAKQNYERYVDKYHHNKILTAASLAGIAGSLEQLNRIDEAAHYYEEAGRKYPRSFKAAEYFNKAGFCYSRAGDILKSREMFRIVFENYPESSLSHEAIFLYESLPKI